MSRRARAARCVRVLLRAGALRRLVRRAMRPARYDLVADDEGDPRLPLHPDQAFHYGITFRAKYIGTMDVPRPTSRVEIVAAMRRVRYEFKAKGAKKRKVTVAVSLEGVRVTARGRAAQKKRSRLFSRSKKAAECVELLHHPIYRIFYVSHDSADLKIFSYIARDGATDAFKCSVFKSTNKSQAMKIVRTVGQAFEVCHKMAGSAGDNPAPSTSSAPDELVTAEPPSEEAASTEPASECGASTSRAAHESRAVPLRAPPAEPLPLPPPPRKEAKREPQLPKPVPSISLPELPECVTKVEASGAAEGEAATPLSAQHQLQLLRERLEQQAQQTRAAVAQLLLLRDQLAAEQAARCEAQARTHQLLVHNKELLEHIAALVAHLQEKEKGNSRPISAQQLTLLPQMRAESADSVAVCNGNCRPLHGDALLEFSAPSSEVSPNLDNNNTSLDRSGGRASPGFGDMTNDQLQHYLISRFQDISFADGAHAQPNGDSHTHFYQNCSAFPHIPPLAGRGRADHSGDEAGAARPMSVGHSQSSPNSTSQPSTSKESSADSSSSDEAPPFIVPLSHRGTLAARDDDGRVRLIVPVSPSPSAAELAAPAHPPATLAVPAAPITRSTSEKVPNRSDLMEALRAQWTRHTTK